MPEQKLAQEQTERFGLQEKKSMTAKRREFNRTKVRVVVIQKSHEDMTRGLLLEERLAVLEGDIGETNHLKSIK